MEHSNEDDHGQVVQAAMLAESVSNAIQSSEDTVAINCVLSGFGAKRFILASTLLSEGLGLSSSEVTAYLLVAGAEREIEKLTSIYSKIQHDD